MKKDKYDDLDADTLYLMVDSKMKFGLDKNGFVTPLALVYLSSTLAFQLFGSNYFVLSLPIIFGIIIIYLYYRFDILKFKSYEKKYAKKMGQDNWNKISKQFMKDNYRNKTNKILHLIFAALFLAITLFALFQNNITLNRTRLILNGMYGFILCAVSLDGIYYTSYNKPVSLTTNLKEDILNKYSDITLEEFNQIVKLENTTFNMKNRKSINHLQKSFNRKLEKLNKKYKDTDMTISADNMNDPIYNKKMAYQKAIAIIKYQKHFKFTNNSMLTSFIVVLCLVIPILVLYQFLITTR